MAKKLNVTINFDLDGTIADLYGVPNWLERLRKEDVTPYIEAKSLVPLCLLARTLNRLQRQGYKLGIISWLSMETNDLYDARVTQAKLEWLGVHMPSVKWDSIHIVPYGTPKESFSNGNDILFDDNANVRKNWKGKAYDVNNIIEILKTL